MKLISVPRLFACLSFDFSCLPACWAIDGSVPLWFEWDFAWFSACCACCCVCFVFLVWVEEFVAAKFGPACFGVFEHLGVFFQPTHHVEETFCSFVFAFVERGVA